MVSQSRRIRTCRSQAGLAICYYHGKGVLKDETEGRAEEKIEIARNLKKKGLDITLIAETTGLSPKEIKRL